MREPVSRMEAQALEERILCNIASCAAGLEALESLLIKKGILQDNELMTEVRAVLGTKTEQAQAAAATSSLVTEV